ncbi:MAG: BatD family protein, partial [Gammaproteobacteria bacterium]
FKGKHWLPAKEVHLEQNWSGDIANMKPGEPLTRTVTLLAKGATVGQLPELNNIDRTIRSDVGGELKNYPDQPVLKEQQKPDGVIAFREEKVAVIPSSGGVYRLPAIEIPWWNTETGRIETARIPEQTLAAVSAGGEPSRAATQGPSPETDATPQPRAEPRPRAGGGFWMGLSLFLGIGWACTLALWLFRRGGRIKPKTENKPATPRYDNRALKQACARHDAAAAKDALLQWGRQRWQVNSLGKIAHRCDGALAEEILSLNRVVYGRQPADWNGDKLLAAFNRFERLKDDKDNLKEEILQPLYKV